MQRLKFSDLDKKSIISKFCEKQKAINSSAQILTDRAELFVALLENAAEAIPEFKAIAIEKDTTARKREMGKLFRQLTNAAETISEIDSAAWGYICWASLKRAGESSDYENLSLFQFMLEARDFQRELADTLNELAVSASEASKNLPPLTFSHLQETAIYLYRIFQNNGIEFTVSNAGFAADCIRKIFNLGGHKIDDVQHWLEIARDNEEKPHHNL